MERPTGTIPVYQTNAQPVPENRNLTPGQVIDGRYNRPDTRPDNRPDTRPSNGDSGKGSVKPPTVPADNPGTKPWTGGNDKSSATRPGDNNGKNTAGTVNYDFRTGTDRGQVYHQPSETNGKHDAGYTPGGKETIYRPYQGYNGPVYEKRTKYPPMYAPANLPTHSKEYYGYSGYNYNYSTYRPPVYRGGFYYYSCDPVYRPCQYGHWVFECNDPDYYRRSIYFYFGSFQYIETSYVRPVNYRVYNYYDRPVIFNGDRYYLAGTRVFGLESALQDIKDAWLSGRTSLLTDRVDPKQMIAVLLDGKYDYSINGDDYAAMTVDAIDDIQTISFDWDMVKQRTNGDFTAFARHTYYNSYGRKQTTYVTYTLRKIAGEFMIVEVGSSEKPLN